MCFVGGNGVRIVVGEEMVFVGFEVEEILLKGDVFVGVVDLFVFVELDGEGCVGRGFVEFEVGSGGGGEYGGEVDIGGVEELVVVNIVGGGGFDDKGELVGVVVEEEVCE